MFEEEGLFKESAKCRQTVDRSPSFFVLVHALCNLPVAWRGHWYQRGMSSLLEITDEHIQTKGRCIDGLPLEQYYLFTDRYLSLSSLLSSFLIQQ